MRKHNRNSPPGIIELGEGLLLSFRIRIRVIKRGNARHSRRALSMVGCTERKAATARNRSDLAEAVREKEK